jgi:hypothetical protein
MSVGAQVYIIREVFFKKKSGRRAANYIKKKPRLDNTMNQQ